MRSHRPEYGTCNSIHSPHNNCPCHLCTLDLTNLRAAKAQLHFPKNVDMCRFTVDLFNTGYKWVLYHPVSFSFCQLHTMRILEKTCIPVLPRLILWYWPIKYLVCLNQGKYLFPLENCYGYFPKRHYQSAEKCPWRGINSGWYEPIS